VKTSGQSSEFIHWISWEMILVTKLILYEGVERPQTLFFLNFDFKLEN